MIVAYIDAVGGVAGDMILAGFLSAGIEKPEQFINEIMKKLKLNYVRLELKKTRRGGFKCWQVITRIHKGKTKKFTSLEQIIGIISKASIEDEVKKKSIAIFKRLAKAEAEAHGVKLKNLHLHETGQTDSIVEIVGTISAIKHIGIKKIFCSPLPLGRGKVMCSHGLIPLPAPAVIEMLKGIPVAPSIVERETVTPTGVAIVREIASKFSGQIPPLKVLTIGIGGGTREDEDFPNIVRVIIGEKQQITRKSVIGRNHMIETNIDNMEPFYYDYLIKKLFASGALDVFITPILMKKSRPSHKISILCEPDKKDILVDTLFRETTTGGVRIYEVEKRELPKKDLTIKTKYGNIGAKQIKRGRTIYELQPEYDDCVDIALKSSVPLRDIIELLKREK